MNGFCPACGSIRYNIGLKTDSDNIELRFCRVCDTEYKYDYKTGMSSLLKDNQKNNK